jgi:hypothetical protein
VSAERRGRYGLAPKISDKVARAVIEKVKAGKSSVMVEARRLGVYHATLRKAMRAAVGAKAHAKVTGRRCKRVTSTGPQQGRAHTTPLPVVDDPTRCRRCGEVLRYGTDGTGFVTAWCVCGWRER